MLPVGRFSMPSSLPLSAAPVQIPNKNLNGGNTDGYNHCKSFYFTAKNIKYFSPQRLPFSTFTDYPSEREKNGHPPSRLRREVRK